MHCVECVFGAKKCLPTIEKEAESDFLLPFFNNHRKLITFDAHPNDIIIAFTPEIPYFSFHFYRWKNQRPHTTEYKRNAKAHLVRVCAMEKSVRYLSVEKIEHKNMMSDEREKIRGKRSKAQTNALYDDTFVSVNIYLWVRCKVEHVCALHPFFGSRSKEVKKTLLHDSPSLRL